MAPSWQAIKETFFRLAPLSASERDAQLNLLHDEAPAMWREVARLIKHIDQPDSLLDSEALRRARVSVESFRDGEVLEGRFRIVRFVALGGMGEVYEVEDLDLGIRKALKTILARMAGQDLMRRYFRREIAIAQGVHHQNVCHVFDQHRVQAGDSDILCYTMEFIDGKTLADILSEKGKLAPAEALPIARQIAEGLTAIHASNPARPLVHRDLKPGNVMITDAGRVVITDLGLARAAHEAESADTLSTEISAPGFGPGTTLYMAPEQFGGGDVMPAADIYAFGLILYEMVTGARAFTATDPVQLGVARRTERPDPPRVHCPDLPERWQDVLLWCLETEPDRRPRTAVRAVEAIGDPKIRIPHYDKKTSEEIPIPNPWWKEVKRALRVAATPAVLLIGIIGPLVHPPTRAALLDRACDWAPGTALFCVLPADKDIAILPFEIVADTDEDRALASGLVRHISDGLYRLRPNKGETCVHLRKDESPFGELLALTGTASTAGDTVTLTARIESASGRVLRSWNRSANVSDAQAVHIGFLREIADQLELAIPTDQWAAWAGQAPADSDAFASFLRGLGYADAERLEEAAAALVQSARYSLGFGSALVHAATAEVHRLRYVATRDESWANKALNAYSQAAGVSDDVPDLELGLGRLAFARRNYQEAAVHFQRAFEADPQDFYAGRALAQAYEAMEKPADVDRVLDRLTDSLPGCWYVYNHRGQYYARQGAFEKAEKEFLYLIRLTPYNVAAHINLSWFYNMLGRSPDARLAAERALELDRGSRARAHALLNLGQAYGYLDCHDAAVNALEQAIEADPSNYRGQLLLAEVYARSGQSARAVALHLSGIDAAREALLRQPDVIAHHYLALALARLDRPEQALQEINSALALAPERPDTLFHAARVYAILKRPERAFHAIEAALRAGYPVFSMRRALDLAPLTATSRYQELEGRLGLGDLHNPGATSETAEATPCPQQLG